MPPKRIARPRSSSSDDSSDDDAPMEVSMKQVKSTALSSEQIRLDAIKQLEQERQAQEAERQRKLNMKRERKRQRTLKQEAKRIEEDDENEDDDESDVEQNPHQVVQLATTATSIKFDDFGFTADELQQSAQTTDIRKKQHANFQLNDIESEFKTTESALRTKQNQQKLIAQMLKAQETANTDVLNGKSRQVGRFNIQVQKSSQIGTTKNKQPSARELLAAAHGFGAGQKKAYQTVKLATIPRIHASTDHRFARGGVSQSLLDKGQTKNHQLSAKHKSKKKK